MKLLSWNVRGLGSWKKRAITKQSSRINPNVVIIQETKLATMNLFIIIKSLWSAHGINCATLDANGSAGGILIL